MTCRDDAVGSSGGGNSVDDLAVALLQESRSELERVDTKVLGVLGFASVFVSVILAGIIAGDWTPSKLDLLGRGIWWAGCALVIVGIVVLAAALWPRLRKSDKSQEGCVTYFGDVDRKWSVGELRHRLRTTCELTESRAADQLLTIAPLVKRKYTLMRWGVASIGAGLLGAGLALLA